MAITGEDRRGDARIEARLEVVVPLGGDERRAVTTSNISRGGMRFSVQAPASLPGELDVTLLLPGGDRVTLHSEVRHVARRDGGYEVGVQFCGLDDAERRALVDALSFFKPVRS